MSPFVPVTKVRPASKTERHPLFSFRSQGQVSGGQTRLCYLRVAGEPSAQLREASRPTPGSAEPPTRWDPPGARTRLSHVRVRKARRRGGARGLARPRLILLAPGFPGLGAGGRERKVPDTYFLENERESGPRKAMARGAVILAFFQILKGSEGNSRWPLPPLQPGRHELHSCLRLPPAAAVAGTGSCGQVPGGRVRTERGVRAHGAQVPRSRLRSAWEPRRQPRPRTLAGTAVAAGVCWLGLGKACISLCPLRILTGPAAPAPEPGYGRERSGRPGVFSPGRVGGWRSLRAPSRPPQSTRS